MTNEQGPKPRECEHEPALTWDQQDGPKITDVCAKCGVKIKSLGWEVEE